MLAYIKLTAVNKNDLSTVADQSRRIHDNPLAWAAMKWGQGVILEENTSVHDWESFTVLPPP